MHAFELHYLNQAGLGFNPSEGIGPVYAAPLYLHRGHGMESFLQFFSVGPTHTVARD